MHIGDHLKNGRMLKNNIKMHLIKWDVLILTCLSGSFVTVQCLTALLSTNDGVYKTFFFIIHMLPQ